MEEEFSTYESPPIDTSPRPFGEIPGLWVKILQMTEEFFAQEAPRASSSNVLISLAILAVATAILSALSSLIGAGVQTTFLPPEYRDVVPVSAGGNALCSLCIGLIGTILGFYLGNGLIYLGARAFGGTGDFGTQTYLQSLFAVPLGIISALVGLVPCLGLIAALAVAVYGVVLSVRVVKVVHKLTTGNAVAAVLVPAVVIALIVACLVIVMLTLLAPAIGNIFEEITTNMY